MNHNSNHYVDILYRKYNRLVISREELSEELYLSVSTIERLINQRNLPIGYKREGTGKKAKYIFPIQEVANYLTCCKVA